MGFVCNSINLVVVENNRKEPRELPGGDNICFRINKQFHNVWR